MTIDPRKRALLSASRPFATCFSSSPWMEATASLDAGGIDVRDHDRGLEPPQEQRRELGRHQPRADDADALDASRLRVGDADAALDAALDEVERVDAGLRLRARQQVAERVFLGPVALLHRPACGAGDQVERAVWRERGAVDGVVDAEPGLAAHLGRLAEVGLRPRLPPFLDRAHEPLDRVVQELDVVEQLVGEADLDRLRGIRGAGSA